MSTYSVAEAKAGLPSLIKRAMAGEEVIITRHGKPVAEIRPASIVNPAGQAAALERLRLIASSCRRARQPPWNC